MPTITLELDGILLAEILNQAGGIRVQDNFYRVVSLRDDQGHEISCRLELEDVFVAADEPEAQS